MTVVRVLWGLVLFAVSAAVVSFVLYNHQAFGVSLPPLEFGVPFRPEALIQAPSIPLFVFCASFFVLGVLLMGLASMQVYLQVVGSWRRLKKQRKAYEPERRELERARAALARESAEHDPKRRELEFRQTELDHRTEELRRERETLAEGRSHLAQERAEIAKDRSALGREQLELERGRRELERARADLALERERAEAAARDHALAHAAREHALPVASAPTTPIGLASQWPGPAEPEGARDPDWDLARSLDDEVDAVAHLSRVAESAPDADEQDGVATDVASDRDPEPGRSE